MGFFKNIKSSGDFISAWEARFGSLDRAQLDLLREKNVGLYAAWLQVKDTYDGAVGDFIDTLHMWAFPATDALEYLLAFRTVFKAFQGGMGAPTPHPAFDEWNSRGDPLAPLYPSGGWFGEWYAGLQLGIYKRGTKDGRTAEPGEVIIGKDALELVANQFCRASIEATTEAQQEELARVFPNFQGDPAMLDVAMTYRAVEASQSGVIDMAASIGLTKEVVEDVQTGNGGAVTKVYKELPPIEPDKPFVVAVHSRNFLMSETFSFSTAQEAIEHAAQMRETSTDQKQSSNP